MIAHPRLLASTCPTSYADALQGARSALRYARDAARSGGGWNRLMIELPLPPPGCALDDRIRPDSDAVWPGGVTQRHRVAMRPLVDGLLSGYDPKYLGTIDVAKPEPVRRPNRVANSVTDQHANRDPVGVPKLKSV